MLQGRPGFSIQHSKGAEPPKATPKPYTRHILGIDSGVQSHPKAPPRLHQGSTKAPPKPHQSHPKATSKPTDSQPIGTPKPHQSHTKAPPKNADLNQSRRSRLFCMGLIPPLSEGGMEPLTELDG